MKVHFVNVGYGDAVLIEVPRGAGEEPFRILMDTGSASEEEYPPGSPRIRVSDYLKRRGITVLDLLILSHPHEDHIAQTIPLSDILEIREVHVAYLIPRAAWHGALPVEEYPEGSFLLSSLNSYGRILSHCRERDIPVTVMERDSLLEPSAGLTIRVLENRNEEGRHYLSRLLSLFDENGNVPNRGSQTRDELARLERECNAGSLALLFEWKGRGILLTGDSCPDVWPERMLEELARRDIRLFKMPHHGQIDGITPEAAEAIRPAMVVTSSASDRRNGSSCPECYRVLREHCGEDTRFLFTDELVYEPYFRAPGPFNALVISPVAEGEDAVELFSFSAAESVNSRAKALV